MICKLVFCTTLCLTVAQASSASDHEAPSARAMYLDRERFPAEIGSRYHILLAAPDGTQREVPVSHLFSSGERVRLRMEVRNPVYVYVLNRTRPYLKGATKAPASESQQPLRLVFGPQGLDSTGLHVVPSGAAMRFDRNPGLEVLYVILSQSQLFEIESAFDHNGNLRSDGDPGAVDALNRTLSCWLANANLDLPETRPTRGVDLDMNGYAVGRQAGQPVAFEIQLRHVR